MSLSYLHYHIHRSILHQCSVDTSLAIWYVDPPYVIDRFLKFPLGLKKYNNSRLDKYWGKIIDLLVKGRHPEVVYKLIVEYILKLHPILELYHRTRRKYIYRLSIGAMYLYGYHEFGEKLLKMIQTYEIMSDEFYEDQYNVALFATTRRDQLESFKTLIKHKEIKRSLLWDAATGDSPKIFDYLIDRGVRLELGTYVTTFKRLSPEMIHKIESTHNCAVKLKPFVGSNVYCYYILWRDTS